MSSNAAVVEEADWQGLYDQLKAELDFVRSQPFVPRSDYDRVLANYDNALTSVASVCAERDAERAARQEADVHVDALMGKVARLEQSSMAVSSETLRSAVSKFVTLFSEDVESGHSTPEKQGAWRALLAAWAEGK